jgi:hypothetical protein
MTLHLIKLCVGAESTRDLADWQSKKRAEGKSRGEADETYHLTRLTPRCAAELLDGGSLYWVIKGQIAVRQRLLGLRPAIKGNVPHCAIVLDHKLVPVERRFHRPFQGWRYLKASDAPRDLKAGGVGKLPESLRAELAELGLL